MNRERVPKGYDGTGVTNRSLSSILEGVMSRLNALHKERPDLLLAAWPEIIGEKMAPMTQALSFSGGKLVVGVNNSTLHQLLVMYEKPKILAQFKKRFPHIKIDDITFRCGGYRGTV